MVRRIGTSTRVTPRHFDLSLVALVVLFVMSRMNLSGCTLSLLSQVAVVLEVYPARKICFGFVACLSMLIASVPLTAQQKRVAARNYQLALAEVNSDVKVSNTTEAQLWADLKICQRGVAWT